MRKDILFPLRRLHGKLHEQALRRKEKKQLLCYLKQNGGTKVLIPGTPEHSNLGDSAIVLAQMAFLRACGFKEESIREVSFADYPKFHKAIRSTLRKNTIVTHLGGGNMGSSWKNEEQLHRMVVEDFPRNPMVIFPQTLYYAPDAMQERDASISVYNKKKNLIITAREKTSFSALQSLYPETKSILTPDIVLSATMETFGAKPQERNGVLFCMRADKERVMTDNARAALGQAVEQAGETFRYTDMHTDKPVNKETRTRRVQEKMEEIASARLVITDRLHGMVFAAVTGTPCIAFSSADHKVKGTYEWISYLPYVRYAQSVQEAEAYIPELLALEHDQFDNTPLKPYFETLKQVVKDLAGN